MDFQIAKLEKPEEGTKPRTYCGPTVIMLLTGVDRIGVHQSINRYRNKLSGSKYKTKQPIKGMWNSELFAVLKKMGVKLSDKKTPLTGISLKSFADDYQHFKNPVIINVTGHYVLLFRGMIYDSFKPHGETYEAHPYKGTRVKRFWIVEKQPLLKQETARFNRAEPKKKAPKEKRDLQAERHAHAVEKLDEWQKKRKSALTIEKKWRQKVRYYERKLAAKAKGGVLNDPLHITKD